MNLTELNSELLEERLKFEPEPNKYAEDKTFRVFDNHKFVGWVGFVGDGWDYRKPPKSGMNYKDNSSTWQDKALKTKLKAAKEL